MVGEANSQVKKYTCKTSSVSWIEQGNKTMKKYKTILKNKTKKRL